MQVFDKQYKVFGIINLIDLVVVVALVAAGFAVYRVLAPEPTPTGVAKGVQVHYTVLCPAQRSIGPEQIRVGDTMFKVTGGKAIGKVEAVRAVASPGEAWDYDQNVIRPYKSTMFTDILIDVVVNAKPTEQGVSIGDVLLHSGAPTPVMTSTYQCDSAFLTTVTIGGK